MSEEANVMRDEYITAGFEKGETRIVIGIKCREEDVHELVTEIRKALIKKRRTLRKECGAEIGYVIHRV